LRQAQVGFDVALLGVERYFGVYPVFDGFALLQSGLRFFLVLPEIRLAVCGRILRQRKLRTSWMRLFNSAKRCCRSSMCSAIAIHSSGFLAL
jgi:hypothetical protein